jgi:hypothetical protein
VWSVLPFDIFPFHHDCHVVVRSCPRVIPHVVTHAASPRQRHSSCPRGHLFAFPRRLARLASPRRTVLRAALRFVCAIGYMSPFALQPRYFPFDFYSSQKYDPRRHLLAFSCRFPHFTSSCCTVLHAVLRIVHAFAYASHFTFQPRRFTFTFYPSQKAIAPLLRVRWNG